MTKVSHYVTMGLLALVAGWAVYSYAMQQDNKDPQPSTDVSKLESVNADKGNSGRVVTVGDYNYLNDIVDWTEPTKDTPAMKKIPNSLKYYAPKIYRNYRPPVLKNLPSDLKIISKGCKVTSNTLIDPDEYLGLETREEAQKELQKITDGSFKSRAFKKKEPGYVEGQEQPESVITVTDWFEEDTGEQPYFQVDLNEKQDIYILGVWNFYHIAKWYNDFLVLVSDDPEFKKDVYVLWNNDYNNSLKFGVGKDKNAPTHWWGHVLNIPERMAQLKSENRGFLPLRGSKQVAPKSTKLSGRYIRVYVGSDQQTDAEPSIVEIAAWGRDKNSKIIESPNKTSHSKTNTKSNSAEMPDKDKKTIKLNKMQIKAAIATRTVKTPKPVRWKHLEKQPAVRPGFLMLPNGARNIALNKPVTSSIPEEDDLFVGELEMITNGDKRHNESLVSLDTDVQWVQIDLGKVYTIYGIAMWKATVIEPKRVFKGVKI